MWKTGSGAVFVLDHVVGKHLYIDYAVSIEGGRVRRVDILAYRELYGGEVRSPSWLSQFVGKTSSSPLKVGSDIRNISGATLSSMHVTEGVQRILAAYGHTDSICRARPLLGTFVEIRSAGRGRAPTERAIDAAFGATANVHHLMSFHDPDSDVSRLNRNASKRNVAIHPWTFRVLQTALTLHRHSGGVFDVTVAPVLQGLGCFPTTKWNWKTTLRKMQRATPSNCFPDIAFGSTIQALELISEASLKDSPSIAQSIYFASITNRTASVNAGGDLAAFGRPPETILIRDPRFPRDLLCQVSIANAALASSARLFNPFEAADCFGSSTIDPASQKPAIEIAGATVRAQSCTIADALTKVVMIAGKKRRLS